MTRFWRIGFAVQLTAVTAIVVGAYLGRLPTFYQHVPYADKVAHATLFGLLAFFLDGALGHRPLRRGGPAWLRLAPVLVLVPAALEEIAQRFSPRRTASLLDYSADVVGVVVLTWAAGRLTAWRAQRASLAGNPQAS